MDQQMAAIVELRARQEATDEAVEKLDSRVTKHDEIIADLRTAMASVATKADVQGLRDDVNRTFNKQLTDAHNSIPAWIGVILTGGSVLVAIITLVFHHG